MGQTFFGFSESNIYKIRETVFYLVKWGFNRDELLNMPIYEYEEYVKFLNRYYKEKNRAAEARNNISAPSSKNKNTNTFGTLPGTK